MSYRPLHEDEEIQSALDEFSRCAENCAILVARINRGEGVKSHNDSLQNAYDRKKKARQGLLSLVNTRISEAYSSGVDDGARRTTGRQ